MFANFTGKVRSSRMLTLGCSAFAALSWHGAILARGQWTVVNLHPDGASFSMASAVHGDQQQVGTAEVGGVTHASLWSGTAASWVDLQPLGAISSGGNGVDVNQQVGLINSGSGNRAALWNDTAESWVDLHPAAAAFSEARDVCGIRQAGYTAFGGPTDFTLHAAMWTGTAATWIDLHPPGMPVSTHSRINATDCAQQTGYFRVDGAPPVSFRASLWSGTADSWVNLHPAAAVASIAHGVHDGQQVGEVRMEELQQRASLWTGTAESWVNLHPAGATYSVVYSVHNGQQVGEAGIDGAAHASFWNDTAASWIDLHSFLPPEFVTSSARGISHSPTFIYVVGFGFNSATLRDEALMWIAPRCAGDVNNDDSVDVDDLIAVILAWGDCAEPCPPTCAADTNADCAVDVDDLITVILGWGDCP